MRVVDKQFGAMIHSSRSFGVADFEFVVEEWRHRVVLDAFIFEYWAFSSHEALRQTFGVFVLEEGGRRHVLIPLMF